MQLWDHKSDWDKVAWAYLFPLWRNHEMIKYNIPILYDPPEEFIIWMGCAILTNTNHTLVSWMQMLYLMGRHICVGEETLPRG